MYSKSLRVQRALNRVLFPSRDKRSSFVIPNHPRRFPMAVRHLNRREAIRVGAATILIGGSNGSAIATTEVEVEDENVTLSEAGDVFLRILEGVVVRVAAAIL